MHTLLSVDKKRKCWEIGPLSVLSDKFHSKDVLKLWYFVGLPLRPRHAHHTENTLQSHTLPSSMLFPDTKPSSQNPSLPAKKWGICFCLEEWTNTAPSQNLKKKIFLSFHEIKWLPQFLWTGTIHFLFLDCNGSSDTCPQAGRSQESETLADREEDKWTWLLLFYENIHGEKKIMADEINRLILCAWTCYMPLRQREFHRISKMEERGCGIFNVFSMERVVSLRGEKLVQNCI